MKCNEYIKFLQNNLKTGKSVHHILLKSIFGIHDDITIKLTYKSHAHAHVLLALDNLNTDYSEDLGKICLAVLIMYRKHSDRFFKKTIKLVKDNEKFLIDTANIYAASKANLSDLAIETRKNNMNGVNESGANLKGILHKKISKVIEFIESNYNDELTIDNFSNAIASKGHQRKSEKQARWKMLFEICGQTLLDNGLSKKYFNKIYKEYEFLDKERFKEWSIISVELSNVEKKKLHKFFSKLK